MKSSAVKSIGLDRDDTQTNSTDSRNTMEQTTAKDIVAKYADAWIGNKSMTSELSHQFSFLVTELKEYNHQEALEEFKNIFPEWEWNSENGGFREDVNFRTAAERLYNWLNTSESTMELSNIKYATQDVSSLPLASDVWTIILRSITDPPMTDSTKDYFGENINLRSTLSFASSVSKQLNAVCKQIKKMMNIDKPVAGIKLMAFMARHGNIECIRYLHINGCPWDFETCYFAAANGHLKCLKYAHENGCQWGKWTCSYAAFNGHLECLKYAHENGCQWDKWTCSNAAENGYLECLKYAHENGCRWDIDTCSDAAANGHLECLQYAHKNGCPWDKQTCSKAAKNGHLECLKYAHENGCEWDKDTCSNAAENGHLECLKYAHENGCPWNEDTCTAAAENGHVECLQYAHENGCPWNEDTCTAAAQNGHVECLQYAHESGCEWDGDTCKDAALEGHLECLQYAVCTFVILFSRQRFTPSAQAMEVRQERLLTSFR